MTKSFSLLLFAAIATVSLRSQTVNYTTDSLKKILCKTWEMQYADFGGMKIGAKPGVNMVVLTFRGDNKVIVTGTATDDKPRIGYTTPKRNMFQF